MLHIQDRLSSPEIVDLEGRISCSYRILVVVWIMICHLDFEDRNLVFIEIQGSEPSAVTITS